MRIWTWILGLFRRDPSQDEPIRDQHLLERYQRDASAASVGHAWESGVNSGGSPYG